MGAKEFETPVLQAAPSPPHGGKGGGNKPSLQM